MQVSTLVNTEGYVNYSLANFDGTLKLSNFKDMDMKLIYNLIYYLCKIRKIDKIYVDNGSVISGNILGGRLKGKSNIELVYKGIVITEGNNYKHKVVWGKNCYEITTLELNKLLGTDLLKNKYKKFREYLIQDLKEIIYIYDTKIDLEDMDICVNESILKDLALYYDLDSILYDTRFLLKYLNSGYKVPTILFNFLNNLYSSHISKLTNISNHVKNLTTLDIDKNVVDSYISTLSYKDINLRYSIDSYLMYLLDTLETNKLKEEAIQKIVYIKGYLTGEYNDDIYHIVTNVSGTRLYKTKAMDSRLLSVQEVKRGIYGYTKYVDLIDCTRSDLASQLGSIVLNTKVGKQEVVYTLGFIDSLLTRLEKIDLEEYLNTCKDDIARYDYVYLEGIDEELKSISSNKDYVKELKAFKLSYVKDSKLKNMYIDTNNDLSVLQDTVSDSETSFYFVSIGKDILSRARSYEALSSKQKDIILKYYTFLTDSTLRQCRVLNLFREYILQKKVKGYYSCLSIVDTILKKAEYTTKQASAIMEFYLEFIKGGDSGFEIESKVTNFKHKTAKKGTAKSKTKFKTKTTQNNENNIDFTSSVADIANIL